MKEALWWKQPLRVIQTNLQVKDTPLMDAEKIAAEIQAMAGNVLVVNVGGIYAWYPSKVRYHHINEYLPKEGDLLQELIDACHRRSIRVVARFDFSKTDDYVYQEKPQWFVRQADRSPRAYGVTRPGDWSILYTTCINAGYRNQEVAVPVLEEVIDSYKIDGIFFNAPHYEYCCCDACRQKYQAAYGKPLPIADTREDGCTTFASIDGGAQLEPSFASLCVRDNMEKIYGAVKKKAPDMPLILYYNLYKDNLNDRLATADMICTEPQDVLSLGYREIPQFWKPALSMKMGRTVEACPAPFGIIHSCPGMDWRHTGLPPAEYRFWMSQIPAGGGQIWHSITGFADTISDKRILQAVGDINHQIAATQQDMDGAVAQSDVLLLWNAKASAEGWAEALIGNQIQFDLLDSYQLTQQSLDGYRVVIAPDQYNYTPELVALLTNYVEQGGRLLAEGSDSELLEGMHSLLGIGHSVLSSEYLAASYWQFEPEGAAIRNGFQDTPLLPHRGVVAYVQPLAGTKTLATLIPPFAPLHAVGAPPERASMLVSHTDLPLCTLHTVGRGEVLYLPFQLSHLIGEYKLEHHLRLVANLVGYLNPAPRFAMEAITGLQAMVYEKPDRLLVHLVNGIGQRPLVHTICCHDICLSLRVPVGKQVAEVVSRLGDTPSWEISGDLLTIRLARLAVWDMLAVLLE